MPTIATDRPSEKLHLLVESAQQYYIPYGFQDASRQQGRESPGA
ncbi:hypothetical protein [Photorhabdus sp. RM71S]